MMIPARGSLKRYLAVNGWERLPFFDNLVGMEYFGLEGLQVASVIHCQKGFC